MRQSAPAEPFPSCSIGNIQYSSSGLGSCWSLTPNTPS